jgi:hypothetical protein
MTSFFQTIALFAALLSAASAASIELHPVPISAKSPRLLGMSMDEDGFIWLGSTHRRIYRYDPRAAATEEIPLPFDSSTSQCICVGTKVYLLGQAYPKLIIYDRTTRSFREVPYPSAKPDVWYGTEAIEGRYLYLFDRGSAGVIKWDTQTDTGVAIPYPYETLLPSGGRYVAADGAVWCIVWDYSRGLYEPVGIARLDVKSDRFTGFFPFPKDAAGLSSYGDPEGTLFYPHTLKGRLVPFDWRTKRWCTPLDVPEFGRRFGFIGLATLHAGRWYFSLSTYNGTPLGCDGLPYHFCNALLEFDPRTSRFAFPMLATKDSFFQVSYTLSAGGHFYATGNNIREPDGTLNASRAGEAIFWQTLKPRP